MSDTKLRWVVINHTNGDCGGFFATRKAAEAEARECATKCNIGGYEWLVARVYSEFSVTVNMTTTQYPTED